MTAQSQINTGIESNFTSPQIEASLINFLTALSSQHCSSATIRNYRSDIRQFYKFMEIDELDDLFSRQSLKDFVLSQHYKGLKDSSVTRKIASITQFALWCEDQGLIDGDISWMSETSINSLLNTKVDPNKTQENKKGLLSIFKNKNSNKIDQLAKQDDSAKITDAKLVSQFATQQKPNTKKSFASTTNLILPYLNLGLMILFFIGLGFLGYNQLVKETPVSFAYPSTPTRADRVLSFQGRLTDTAQNPVTIPTPMEFKIWDQLTGGTEGTCDGTTDCKYQTGSCSVTPDQDGIFNVGIGDDCGIEIDDAVFTENSALWLEVIVDSETLTPRQPIRTVPFAVNSETVQGFPINSTQSATTNTILVMDAGGNVTLGENDPKLRSVSGTFTISGGTISLEAVNDILFSDARVTDLPLSLVDTQLDPSLSQGIVDAINDVYSFSAGNAFWSELDSLLHPTQYWNDDLAVGGNSTSSAGIWLSNTGAAVFNEQGNDADFRVESDSNQNALSIDGASGSVGIGIAPSSSYQLLVNGMARFQRTMSNTNDIALNISGTYNGTGGTAYGFNGNIYNSGTTVSNLIGGQFSSVHQANSTIGTAIGMLGRGQSAGTTGQATDLIGVQGDIYLQGTGNATRGTAFYAGGGSSSGGDITTAYGLRVADLSLGLTNYAVYTEGTTQSYFGGNVGIGDTTPDHKLDVAGNIGLDASGYINWGDVDGTSGYGVRDNAGTLQFKNSSGSWTDFGVAGNTYWDFISGTLIPRYVTADVNIGGTSTDSAKISLAGSLDRGKAAVIINQTENQDILSASYSGVAKFTIANNGNLTLANSEYISNSTDDFLVFGGGNGSINTDLSIDLDGNNPVLFSTAGLGIEINDRLYIGTNNRYFYDDTAELRFSDDLRVDGSFAVGNIASTGNSGELITGSNIIVGDQAELRLREDIANGTNYTGFRAPALLGSDIIYTLPDTAGSTGTVLMNDGSGNLIWGSNTAGDFWQLTDGMLSPSYLGLGLNIGDTATSSAKVSISGALDRGMSALIVNQTENQDIFTASASGATRFTIDYDGNLDVTGDIGLAAGNYINWGSILGTSGYGIRDNAGILQFKNDGGSWLDFGSGSGSGGYWQLNDGAISPYFLTTDANFGATATSAAKVSIASSLTRGMSALIVNQTENQDIFTASASGATRFVIANNGNVGIGDSSPTSLLSVGAGDLFQVDSNGNIVAVGGVGHTISNVSGDIELDSFGGQINFANNNVFNIGGVTGANYNSISNSNTGDVTNDDNDLFVEGFLEVDGNVNLAASSYLNWGDTDGTGGYGFRDNAGTLQYKFSGGNWTDIGLASNAYWQLNNGTISPFSLGADVNIGSNATASAKVSLAGALDRGKAAVIINQTENQDIFAASASGVTRFAIDYGGNATLSGSLELGGQLQLGNFSGDPTAMGEGSLYYNTSTEGVYYFDGSNWVSMGGGNSFWQLNNGALSPVETSYEINLGNIATNSAKISLAGSETRGKAAVIINQTENQDIFAASASGVTKFKIENDGDVYLTQLLGTTYNPYNNIDFINSGIGINSYLNVKIDLDDDNNDTIENFTINTNGGLTELFRVNSNGNTGIGDTTPEGKLDVEGAVTGQALVQINELGNQDIFTASKSGLTRMRIDNDGYVHSQRFVDLANSAYYLDPAATGTSLNAAGDGKLEGGQIYLYNTNTYVSGDGTDLTFKDSHLTNQIALSETGTTQLHAGFTTNSIIAALNELMNISLGDTTNIFLNSLRMQEQHGLLYELFQDGVADEFEGLTGVDTNLSAYTYDSVNDWFSRANPTSDVIHDTQQEFLEGNFLAATVSASPTLELAKTVNLGTGADGDATISATKNLNSDVVAAGRNFADAVAYKVTGIATNAVSTDYAPHGIVAGDEVILINMQGDGSNYGNVGTYEFLTVSSVSGLNIAFTSNVLSTYGVGGNANLSGQDVMIQRVPQYNDVTVTSGGTLTTGDWDNLTTVPTSPTGTAGYQTGLLVFRATGEVNVLSGGAISVSGKGYQGGAGANVVYTTAGYQGESTSGVGAAIQTPALAEAGGAGGLQCNGGDGGGYATGGSAGLRTGSSCGGKGANGTSTYGDANLTKLYLGSGGGGGGMGYGGAWNIAGGAGGDGGGVAYISAKKITSSAGSLTSNGTNGGAGGAGDTIAAGGGGGGAGGSIHLKGEVVNVSGTVTASAGTGGQTNVSTYGSSYNDEDDYSHGGNGGVGRIKVDATTTIGTTTPTFTAGTLSLYKSYGIYTSDEISTPNTISFDLIEWTENLNTHGEVQIMTRSGSTSNSTDGSWEEWRPIVTNTNEKIIDNMDAQANWTPYTPIEIIEDTQNEFGYNNETFRTIESGGLDGSVTIEKYIDNGDGHDGSITVSSSKNINTDIIAAGRSYADGISYAVSVINSASVTTSATPNGIVAGDEVMLINMQGDSATTYANTGNYEFAKVSLVSGSILYFEEAVENIYGVGSNLDLTGQKVVVQRVPQYNNVTVQSGGTITASDWNGTSGGLLVFRVAGTLDIQSGGTITMNGKGYRGGAGANVVYTTAGYQGESTSGVGAALQTPALAEAGGAGGLQCNGGDGGGYATGGSAGLRTGSSCGGKGANGTSTYGDSTLAKLYMGSAGGGGGMGYGGLWNIAGGAGGDGGGIVYISADTVTVTGTLNNNGTNGGAGGAGDTIAAGGGGGGAGGSSVIQADVINITGTLAATAGTGGQTNVSTYGTTYNDEDDYSHGGDGGVGRIRIDANRVAGSSSPSYSTGVSNLNYHNYGIFTSTELAATSSAVLDTIEWVETLGNTSEIQIQTRTGNSNNATDGTWEAWKPVANGTNELSVHTLNTHTDWVGTNVTVAEGDTTRNIDNFEDEDESTAGNLAKFTTSTEGGYAQADLGSGNTKNLTSYDYLSFWIRSDVTSDKFTISFGEADGNEQSEEVIIDNINTWQKVYWDLTDIAAANRDAVRYLRITNNDIPTVNFYLDNIVAGRYIGLNSGEQIPSTNNNYIQYRAILTTTNNTTAPVLEDLTINYRTSSTYLQVQEGDTTRNENYYEDEDESTAGNISKFSFTKKNGYIERDLGTPVDLSNYDYLSFWMKTTEIGEKWQISMGENSSIEMSKDVHIETANTWQKVYWDLTNLSTASRNAIQYLRFTQIDSGSTTVYLDDMAANRYETSPTNGTIASSANEYIQYRVILSTTSETVTPTVSSVTINYTDQLGYIDNTQDDFDTGTTKFQAESTAGNTVQVSNNRPFVGLGEDGSITVSTTKSINSDVIASGRAYADGAVYAVTSLNTNTATTSAVPNGIKNGDEVILMNAQGDGTNYGNVGTYEFLTVESVNSTRIKFTTNIANTYGVGGNSNLTGQKIIIQRVPHYNNVTINNGGTLTTDSWDGTKGGVLVFRASGKVNILGGGSITAAAKGYRGGAGVTGTGASAFQGESTTGTGTQLHTPALVEAGGAGGHYCNGGDGGGHATNGTGGNRSGTSCGGAGASGTSVTYGNTNLTKMYFGSAGGGGGSGYAGAWDKQGGTGGNGGGVVYISANDITVEDGVSLDGTLSAAGGAGGTGSTGETIQSGVGGGGAGGTMYLLADTVEIPVNTTAAGAAAGVSGTSSYGGTYSDVSNNANGGAGGDGRIKINANSVTGTTTPTYVAGTDSGYYYPYAVFTSKEINTAGAQNYDALTWLANLGTGGMVQFMTRSGSTADSTDGTWQEWRPLYATNEAVLQTANTHGDWTGYTPLSKIDDTRAEFDATSVDKFRVSSDTTPSLYLDRYVNDGDGSDGAITISTTKNLNADLIGASRVSYADGIAYKVTASTITGSTLTTADTPNGIAAGDEVLLINVQGGSSDYADVGNYEFLRVSSVVGSNITFTTSIQNSYDGTTPANQKVILQRVPQYTNVTIQSGGTLTTGGWDGFGTIPAGTAGYNSGIVVFRASGNVDVQLNGSISATGKGYRGGNGVTGTGSPAYQGESTSGEGAQLNTPAKAEAGGAGGYFCNGGDGGGHATGGAAGNRSGTSCGGAGASGTSTYGDTNLAKMYFGSGGGGGGSGYAGAWDKQGGVGGIGGGIVFISANNIEVDEHPVSTDGAIVSNGNNGSNGASGETIQSGGGGGGAGGSMYLSANRVDFSGTVTATGGTGGVTGTSSYGGTYSDVSNNANGGAGGTGRIRVNTNETTSTTITSPTYTAGINSNQLHTYGIYTSDELNANSAADFKDIEWFENINTSYSDIQVQTRTGNTADSTTGTWEAWRPVTGGVNTVSVENMNTHTNWTGTNVTVADGDATRNNNFYEDEDESTAGNATKFTSSTQNGYAARDLGAGNEVNLSSYNYLSFWIRADKDNATFKLGMGEAAATEQEETIIIDAADTWQKVYWDLSDMSAAARDSIRHLRITYLDNSPDMVNFYLDNIAGTEILTEPTGSDITSSAGNYVQYRLIFSTTDTTSSLTAPAVYSVKLNYVTPSAVFYTQEGDVTRNVDGYEDEDEPTATNVTRVVASSTDSDGNFVEAVIPSADLTNYDYLAFWIRTSASATEIPMRIGFGELESDEQQMDFVVETPFQWQKVFFDISDIPAASKNAVTKLRVTNLAPHTNDIYIDDFTANRYITSSGYQPNTTANNYVQYRAILTSTNTSSFPEISQVSIAYSGESNVVSEEFEANVLPRRANLISWADLGTGSIDYWASRDNGVTWTPVTMTQQATESGDMKIFSGFADLTSQPEGTTMRWKARINGNAVLASMAMRWESGGGADLAEWYPTADKSISAAEVVSADSTSTQSAYIARTTKAYDPAVIGVISTAPGLQIGEKAENTKRVALAGRVPVKVASDSAAILPGDFIASSNVPGRAMKAMKTGYTIGKALEAWTPGSGKDWVMMFVNLGTYLDGKDIGGVDNASLEEIFGEETSEAVNIVNATGSGENTNANPESTPSGEVNEASESGEIATGSGQLNPNTATASATLVKESLTSRLKKLADERLDAFLGWTKTEATISGEVLEGTTTNSNFDSITKYQSDLFEARNKFVAYGETAKNTVGATTINAYGSLNAAGATIYGKLIAGSAEVYGKFTAVSGQFLDLFSNIIRTNNLQTSMISPIADDGSIHVRLGENKDASSSAKPALVIENSAGSSVTSIDKDGNIITLGTIISKENKTSTVTAEVIYAKDASISGNLDASSARIQELEARIAQVEQVKADTAEIVNATISGTLFAENIDSFSEKVAAAIEEPSLLAKLTGSANQNTVESVEDYFASRSAFLADINTSSPSRLALSDLTLEEDALIIDADAIYVDQYLDVNGSAFVAERLGIGQSLVLSDSMFVTAGSIDFAPEGVEKPILSLQPSGKGVLSLMGNLFTLDDTGLAQLTGNLEVSGDVKVGGTLLANLMKLNDFNNPFQVQLATMSGEVLGESQVQESRFEIVNELGVPVATISAQGKAEFASGLGIGSEELQAATDSGIIESEKTSGTATIKANSSEIVIKSKIVTGKSLIYLTPLGSTNNQVLYIKEIAADNPETPELESSFKVGFDQPVNNDLKFNWWIVN